MSIKKCLYEYHYAGFPRQKIEYNQKGKFMQERGYFQVFVNFDRNECITPLGRGPLFLYF